MEKLLIVLIILGIFFLIIKKKTSTIKIPTITSMANQEKIDPQRKEFFDPYDNGFETFGKAPEEKNNSYTFTYKSKTQNILTDESTPNYLLNQKINCALNEKLNTNKNKCCPHSNLPNSQYDDDCKLVCNLDESASPNNSKCCTITKYIRNTLPDNNCELQCQKYLTFNNKKSKCCYKIEGAISYDQHCNPLF